MVISSDRVDLQVIFKTERDRKFKHLIYLHFNLILIRVSEKKLLDTLDRRINGQ